MEKNAYSMLEIEMIFRACKTLDEVEEACKAFNLLIRLGEQERTLHLHEVSTKRLFEIVKQ